eukprot:755408-Hanusia_phi.AAC.1
MSSSLIVICIFVHDRLDFSQGVASGLIRVVGGKNGDLREGGGVVDQRWVDRDEGWCLTFEVQLVSWYEDGELSKEQIIDNSEDENH